jgi:hypothetical protein
MSSFLLKNEHIGKAEKRTHLPIRKPQHYIPKAFGSSGAGK